MFFVVCVCARVVRNQKCMPGKLLAAWAVASRNLPSGGVLQMQIQVAHSWRGVEPPNSRRIPEWESPWGKDRCSICSMYMCIYIYIYGDMICIYLHKYIYIEILKYVYIYMWRYNMYTLIIVGMVCRSHRSHMANIRMHQHMANDRYSQTRSLCSWFVQKYHHDFGTTVLSVLSILGRLKKLWYHK